MQGGKYRVGLQVKSRSVCKANTLKPAIRALNFSIPTVLGIVSHLILQMLAKPEPLLIDTNPSEKQIRSCNEVTKSFIVNNTLYSVGHV